MFFFSCSILEPLHETFPHALNKKEKGICTRNRPPSSSNITRPNELSRLYLEKKNWKN